MSKFWRIALTWLLALALPIQGYAAQSMRLCGPAHHQDVEVQDHATHDHDDSHTGDHSAVADHEVSAASCADRGYATKAGHAGKCSVCSSCCNATAITNTVIAIGVVAADLPEVATLHVAHDRFMVGGLERPPRLSRP